MGYFFAVNISFYVLDIFGVSELCVGGGGSSGVVLRRVVVAHGLACYLPSKQSDVCLSRIFTYEN